MNRTTTTFLMLLVVFIVSVTGAGAWVFTTPPDYTTNQTGDWFGNASNNGNNYTSDRIDVMNYFGVVVGTYLDSIECGATYCIYQPWYASGQIYSKNTTTGKIDYSGTDAQTVIQNTINANYGTIKILPGTYNINSVVTNISAINDTWIEGYGEKTILKAGDGVALMITNTNYNTASNNHITLKNFKIDMNGQILSQTGLDLNATDSTIEGLIITNVSSKSEDTLTDLGMGIALGSGSNRNAIINNDITNYTHYGIALFIANNTRVIGNSIHDGGRHGIGIGGGSYNNIVGNNIWNTSRDAIYLDTRNGVTPHDNIISGNNIRELTDMVNGLGYGINLVVGQNNAITGNTISDTAQYAIFVSDHYNTISGNSIYNSSWFTNAGSAIALAGIAGSFNTVSGNKINFVNGAGIFTSASGNIINDNLITFASKHGISTFNSFNNTIVGNSIYEIGSTSVNTYSGVNLNNEKGTLVIGNTVRGAKVKDGIEEIGTSYSNLISNNNVFRGFQTTGVAIVGGNTSASNNYGAPGTYYGAHASCTTITPFGEPDYCYNTTSKAFNFYDGSQWRYYNMTTVNSY